jgi:hypothetical protein
MHFFLKKQLVRSLSVLQTALRGARFITKMETYINQKLDAQKWLLNEWVKEFHQNTTILQESLTDDKNYKI